jgi:Uma2 family endonuclease
VTITVSPTLEPIGQVLTPEEYDALPPNSRRELVDGVVRLMATPTPFHQDVANALRNALSLHRPPELRVTGEVEIRLAAGLRRNPDVVVVRAVGYDRRVPRVHPTQVVLAVEVVSPGSESTDREVKPHEYALAGIPHMWRVETDPEIEVHTFRLGDRASYFETGRFASGDVIDAQGIRWAKIAVSALAEES